MTPSRRISLPLLIGVLGTLLSPSLRLSVSPSLRLAIALGPRGQGQGAPADSPRVWSAQKSGTLARLSAVFFTDCQRGWVVGSNSTVLTTEDGGETWRRVPRPDHELLRDVVFLDPQRGFALGEYSLFNRAHTDMPKTRAFLLASHDGGATWDLAPLARATDRAQSPSGYNGDGLLRLLLVDDRMGWACGEAGLILATKDGGQSWQAQRSPVSKLLYSVAAIDPRQAWIAGAGGVILRTVDGGQQWNEQVSGTTETLRAIHFVDARRGWAVGTGGIILATTNGGNRWRAQVSNTEENLNAVFFTSAQEGWAAGDRGTLLHTRDGGSTWEQAELKTRAHFLRLFFIANDCGWAVGTNGAIFKCQPGSMAARPSLRNPKP